ncbi:MAG: hypothetical protein V4537_03930 [Pseudomonadota bacterium]
MPSLRLPTLAVIAAVSPALGVGAQQRPAPPRAGQLTGTVTSVTVQQRMIIRVPRLPVGRTPIAGAAPSAPFAPTRWVEKKTDKCVPVINLAAATVTGSDSVDLLLNGGKRLRARFGSDCPAIDFYSGFYVKMPKDGKVCASRDSFRARSGGECRIKSFRALVADK